MDAATAGPVNVTNPGVMSQGRDGKGQGGVKWCFGRKSRPDSTGASNSGRHGSPRERRDDTPEKRERTVASGSPA